MNRQHLLATKRMVDQERWEYAIALPAKSKRPDSEDRSVVAKYVYPEWGALNIRIWFFEHEDECNAWARQYPLLARLDINDVRRRARENMEKYAWA